MQKFIIRVDSENSQILEKMDEECFVLATSLDAEYCRKFVEKAVSENRVVLFYGNNAI